MTRNVGDIHPKHNNWVWTEYKPGKFDWRIVKNTDDFSRFSSIMKDVTLETIKAGCDFSGETKEQYMNGMKEWWATATEDEKQETIKAVKIQFGATEQAEKPAPAPKARTKKQFIAETNRDLTDEECAEYWKMGKTLDVYARSTWHYAMGRIGSCKLTIENCNTGKSKDFDKHPNWRPLGHYSFSVRGWGGEYIKVEGYIQDWDAIRNISDTESFSVTLMKHPHQ